MTPFRRSYRAQWRCILLSWTVIITLCRGFVPGTRFFRRTAPLQAASFSADDYREEQTRAALVEALVQPEEDVLIQIHLLGRTELKTSTNDTVPCLVLSPNNDKSSAAAESLILPVTLPQLKLLSFAHQAKPLSKSVCLILNPLLVNRDGSLFDNLPWSTWTVDPQKRNRDAANNNVLPKFHLGKRDAYNRFMGKDWKGRSVSLGNMAMRLKYMLEQEVVVDEDDTFRLVDEDSTKKVLAKRVLALQIRELEMELAEWDYQVAVARNNAPDELNDLEQSRQECSSRIVEAKEALSALNQSVVPESSDSLLEILDKVADMTTDEGRNAAPYRGAMGYAPLIDTNDEIGNSMLPYTSPYDLLKEIIDDQLNAQVIGTILENTNFMDGTLVLGGGVILRRKTPKKKVTIAGEELSINDEDEDYGNQGVQGGETFVVECDGDEAIGMSLACEVPIRVEQSIFGRSSMTTILVPQTQENSNVYDSIPLREPADKEMTLLVEGQARNQTNREQTSPLFIPRTTTSLFDSMFDRSSSSRLSSRTMFPTDNPIQSLEEYDALSNAEKARTLTMLSNFEGKLPRPRVLRQREKIGENPLDDLLLPLIDESIRRQYLIRDAERRGDEGTLQKLKSEKSRRQVAKEKAEEARASGSDDVAEYWESEAGVYEGLRADVTQDEGSYSRFLDKDEWYERERLAQARRVNRKSFGTLLDGIE